MNVRAALYISSCLLTCVVAFNEKQVSSRKLLSSDIWPAIKFAVNAESYQKQSLAG